MWLGPVFQAELLTSSRRGRFFVGRVIYGLLILIIVTTTYYQVVSQLPSDSEIPIEAMARFGQVIFAAFAMLQGSVILVMTPALVAGAIADERQRKTLHYLMASELTSAEIVLGKVAARLLRVAVLGAIGLPVLNLIGLFGGVDYQVVLLVYGGTATTTFFLASFSILCSVFASKPRDAIMQCFFVEILWLTVAPIMLATMKEWSPTWQAIGEFSSPALEVLANSSPTNLFRGTGVFTSLNQTTRNVCWMMGLQVGFGAILIGLAAWRLRPNFRAQDGPSLVFRLFGRKQPRARWRFWPRREVGDDAMFWKEVHVNGIGNGRLVLLGLLAITVVGLTLYATSDSVLGAIDEALHDGYWNFGQHQREVNSLLRGANAVAMVVLLFGLAAVSASSVTSEREGDTWINLTSSPLTGVEILRGKILGALWMFRPIAYLLGVGWAFGLVVGAVHPLGVLASLLELAVFAWFITALGVRISLRSKNTIQAVAVTIGILLFINVGYLFLIALLRMNSMIFLLGCMPFLFTVSLMGIDDLRQNWTGPSMDLLIASATGTFLFATGAAFLTFQAISSYDSIVDRPDRRLTPELLRMIRKSQASG